jgi:hypothetical protein
LVLLATVGGVGWALGPVTKGKSLHEASTHHVVVPAGAGERSVNWTIGQATVSASCTSDEAFDPPGGFTFGVVGPFVENGGPDPLAVVSREPTSEPIGGTWLDEGEGAFVSPEIAGEVAVVDEDGNVVAEGPRSAGMTHPFAILDEGGASASGLFASSFRFDPDTMAGHCVFTLQMEG